MEWVIWGVLLLLQNMAFTWVSRARNSSSVSYHALASFFSNGIYIINQGVVINKFLSVERNTLAYWIVVLFYTAFTMTGSLGMHYILMRYVEIGKRKVGS